MSSENKWSTVISRDLGFESHEATLCTKAGRLGFKGEFVRDSDIEQVPSSTFMFDHVMQILPHAHIVQLGNTTVSSFRVGIFWAMTTVATCFRAD
jgi:hypothetical protein